MGYHGLDALKEADVPFGRRSEVVKDPHIMGGVPVIAGTRIPVHFIAWLVERGVSDYDILDDYPSLNLEDIRIAVEYARSHPEEDC